MIVESKMSYNAWFPCYPRDLLGDTDHLSNHDFGAYVRGLCWYYVNGPLPNDDDSLRNLMRVERTEWTRAKGNVLAFFQLNGDGKWHQKRADEIIEERSRVFTSTVERSRKGVETRRKLGQLPPEPGVDPKDEPKVNPKVEPKVNQGLNPTRTQSQSQSQSQSNVQSEPQSKGETPQRKLSSVEHMTFDKEHDRVLSRMKCIKETYASHQRWDDKDKIEFQKLRGRLIELRTLLGIKI